MTFVIKKKKKTTVKVVLVMNKSISVLTTGGTDIRKKTCTKRINI